MVPKDPQKVRIKIWLLATYSTFRIPIDLSYLAMRSLKPPIWRIVPKIGNFSEREKDMLMF
jgi:hypothetical protein